MKGYTKTLQSHPWIFVALLANILTKTMLYMHKEASLESFLPKGPCSIHVQHCKHYFFCPNHNNNIMGKINFNNKQKILLKKIVYHLNTGVQLKVLYNHTQQLLSIKWAYNRKSVIMMVKVKALKNKSKSTSCYVINSVNVKYAT